MNKLKQHIIYILILLVLLGMDQISKNWAISTLKNGEDFILINSILHLSYLENTGVAFSILRNHSYLILIRNMYRSNLTLDFFCENAE